MPDATQLLSTFGWFFIAAVAALAGYFVAMAIRRWSQSETPAENFTFQDLRDMKARGQITAQEFEAMRAALLAGMDLNRDEDERSGGARGAADP